MERAISRVQDLGVIEGDKHPPPHDPELDWTLLANWRQSLVLQHTYTDIKTETIDRAIADDVAFLAAHPTRTKKCSS